MKKHWWQEAVVYQVYPRSFQDTNHDGIGDLQGVIQHLDYIKTLGADVIWLNPIYQSPNDDNGYDISDYRKIMKDFGTMADFEELLAKAHHRGLKIMMDLVVNHTSDEHRWFAESRSSRDNKYRDYYIWHDPVDGHEPNDWQSSFSGSAWQLDEKTGQYYLHLFSKKQPDLNWTNADMRQSIYKMMAWWLDKGVDGFRMDVINLISKPLDITKGGAVANGPYVHQYLQEMNKAVLNDDRLITVGETPDVKPYDAINYAGFDRHELNMIFQFEHMGVDQDPELGKWRPKAYKLSELKQIMSKWQVELHGKAWNSLYWNNHDQPRVVSRFGNDTTEEYRVLSAKMLALTLHFMQGTPYIYQGEELGMTNNYDFNSITDYRDIEAINAYRDLVESRHVLSNQEFIDAAHKMSRDNARTPMQWNDQINAGFTKEGVDPWIAVNSNYMTVNAEKALMDPNSIYYFYQRINGLRHQFPVIVDGNYSLLLPNDERLWVYKRNDNKQTLLVVSNFTDETVTCDLPELATIHETLISNYTDNQGQTLRPYEAKAYLYPNRQVDQQRTVFDF